MPLFSRTCWGDPEGLVIGKNDGRFSRTRGGDPHDYDYQ